MTTGVKDRDELRWVLRAIKKEWLLTPAGENVKLDVAKLTNRDPEAPAMDVVAKHIRLWGSQGIFKVVKKYNVHDQYSGIDTDWECANWFEFAINQEKFDILYSAAFDIQYSAIVENRAKEIDLSSNDAVDFEDEKVRIGKIPVMAGLSIG